MNDRILVVDDEQAQCDVLEASLGKRGFSVSTMTSARAAFDALTQEDFDVVVTDLNMRGMTGLELCQEIAKSRPETSVVVITAFGTMDTAIASIRAGAYDFITKPFDLDMLSLTIERAIRHRRLHQEVTRLRKATAESNRFDDIIGASPAMKRANALLAKVAETDASVLITGESGTGKELVARALHKRSRRASGPFVPLSCAAFSSTLLESELFGHEKAAFTDAEQARTGLFAQANGGTLFLDEIGEMPLELQPKILRSLQEHSVRPLGGNTEVPFDVRVVAATNRDLETAVDEGRFRGDLFYRINVVHIAIPPLRARGTDVLLLSQHFIEHYARTFNKQVAGMSPPVAEKLLAYSWPGNVRELQNCIERAVALTQTADLVVADLPERIQSHRQTHVTVSSFDESELVPLEEIERRYILRVVEAVGYNRTVAARTLGLDRKTLYRKLKAYGAIEPRGEPD